MLPQERQRWNSLRSPNAHVHQQKTHSVIPYVSYMEIERPGRRDSTLARTAPSSPARCVLYRERHRLLLRTYTETSNNTHKGQWLVHNSDRSERTIFQNLRPPKWCEYFIPRRKRRGRWSKKEPARTPRNARTTRSSTMMAASAPAASGAANASESSSAGLGGFPNERGKSKVWPTRDDERHTRYEDTTLGTSKCTSRSLSLSLSLSLAVKSTTSTTRARVPPARRGCPPRRPVGVKLPLAVRTRGAHVALTGLHSACERVMVSYMRDRAKKTSCADSEKERKKRRKKKRPAWAPRAFLTGGEASAGEARRHSARRLRRAATRPRTRSSLRGPRLRRRLRAAYVSHWTHPTHDQLKKRDETLGRLAC